MKIKENGYYKLKTKDGDKWLHYSRLFLTRLEEVSGKDIVKFGEHLMSLDNSLNMEAQFDALTDLTMAAMLAYDEKEGNEIDYDLYKVGEWLYNAVEEDDKVFSDIINTLQAATSPGKQKEGRYRPQKK